MGSLYIDIVAMFPPVLPTNNLSVSIYLEGFALFSELSQVLNVDFFFGGGRYFDRITLHIVLSDGFNLFLPDST